MTRQRIGMYAGQSIEVGDSTITAKAATTKQGTGGGDHPYLVIEVTSDAELAVIDDAGQAQPAVTVL